MDLTQVIENILASYRRAGGINNIDGVNLPSKRQIASICEDLLQLLFPGFHDQEPIHSNHLARVTTYRVNNIAERLKEEICKSLRMGQPDCPDRKAEKCATTFFEQLPRVRELLPRRTASTHQETRKAPQ